VGGIVAAAIACREEVVRRDKCCAAAKRPVSVGRTVREGTDSNRADPYAADPSERRSLVTWIWYPRSPVDRHTRRGVPAGSPATHGALQWCRDDSRCQVAVNLDGALWTEVGRLGLPRPVLQVLAPHHEFDADPDEAVKAGIAPDPDWYAAERAITLGGWETVGRTGRPGYSVQIRGATHLSFMDVPFLELAPGSPAAPMPGATTIDPVRMLGVTNALLVAFLTGADVAAVLTSDTVRAVTSPLRPTEHDPPARG
jgi:hypothetical protein